MIAEVMSTLESYQSIAIERLSSRFVASNLGCERISEATGSTGTRGAEWTEQRNSQQANAGTKVWFDLSTGVFYRSRDPFRRGCRSPANLEGIDSSSFRRLPIAVCPWSCPGDERLNLPFLGHELHA